MNTQIRQFINQACREYVAETGGATIIIPDAWAEKFAQLIVRECLAICQDHYSWTGSEVGHEIEQHFGVKHE